MKKFKKLIFEEKGKLYQMQRELQINVLTDLTLIYGCFIDNECAGYCIVKNHLIRPETATEVFAKFRNQGIATELRNFAISQREFTGLLQILVQNEIRTTF